MFIIYDLIFFLISLVYLPVYLLRKKFHRGFLSRLGILPKKLDLNRPIWIHAVSVGEAMAISGLVSELRIAHPEQKFVISTVTATGNKVARGFAGKGDFVTYLPLDFSFFVRMIIDRINPSLFIIAETEIWPNLISYLGKKNIPVLTVNGRLSDSSFRGYLSIKFLVSRILKKVSLFCMQTPRDAERLINLGVDGKRIQVTGNMKFDAKANVNYKKDSLDYRKKLNLDPSESLLVAGSTHPGEEEIILNIYQRLLKDFPKLKLLIAPRHPERSQEVERLINKAGLQAVRVSRLPGVPVKREEIFILDTVGDLVSYYAISDLVFVGGSLVKKGGHNIIEPASVEKPVLFGPFMFNFRDIAELFLANKAAIKIQGQQELYLEIRDLLKNKDKRERLAQAAKQLIQKNQGATKRNAELIRELIKIA